MLAMKEQYSINVNELLFQFLGQLDPILFPKQPCIQNNNTWINKITAFFRHLTRPIITYYKQRT